MEEITNGTFEIITKNLRVGKFVSLFKKELKLLQTFCKKVSTYCKQNFCCIYILHGQVDFNIFTPKERADFRD